jgi:hypothetical protein
VKRERRRKKKKIAKKRLTVRKGLHNITEPEWLQVIETQRLGSRRVGPGWVRVGAFE